jgi:tetratricopeptide (TPR) repeat protein
MYFNLSDSSFRRDRYTDALGYLQPALELARRLGNRPHEWSLLAELTYPLYMTGRWEEALAALEDLTEEQIRSGAMFLSMLTSVLEIHIHRGQLEQAQRLYSLFSRLETSADIQDQGIYRGATAALRRAEGRFGEALEGGASTVELAQTFGASHQFVKQGLVEAIEAALALGEREKAGELLAMIEKLPPGLRPPYLEAQAHRLRARLDGDEAGYRTAAARFRELDVPFWLGVTLLEHGEEPGLAEAGQIFERLEAAPWLERVTAAAAEHQAHVPA